MNAALSIGFIEATFRRRDRSREGSRACQLLCRCGLLGSVESNRSSGGLRQEGDSDRARGRAALKVGAGRGWAFSLMKNRLLLLPSSPSFFLTSLLTQAALRFCHGEPATRRTHCPGLIPFTIVAICLTSISVIFVYSLKRNDPSSFCKSPNVPRLRRALVRSFELSCRSPHL